MKTKLLKTILMIGLWSALYSIIANSEQISRKYLALNQFDNSEASLQVFNAASNIGYLNWFVIVLAIYSIGSIWWKQNKSVEQSSEQV